jgi:hypothetical protein
MAKIRPPVDQNEWLYRRCFSTPLKRYIDPDGNVTSRAFKLREKDNSELSVDIKSMTTAEISVSDSTKYILCEIPNNEVLILGLTTHHDPCTVLEHGFDNNAHAVILGLDIEDEILPGLLARKSRRVFV